MKIVITAAHSHTWFLTQVFLSSLKKYTNLDSVASVVLVDNSWKWSPTIRAVTHTPVGDGIKVVQNRYPSKYHASALDMVVDDFGSECDYLVTLETDCLLLAPSWLDRLMSSIGEKDYAAGAWHHEQYVNPSIAIYSMIALKQMMKWCRANKSNRCYWGECFTNESELYYEEQVECLGPFSDRRGWTRGTVLKEKPTGQLKGPGHYEPGQMLYHWAIEAGYGKTVIPTSTQRDNVRKIPVSTYYGDPPPWGVHLWAGTRALDILKHPVTDPAISNNSEHWLTREAQLWLETVPKEIQDKTCDMIVKLGWYTREMDDRERAAVDFITRIYRASGIPI